MTSFDRPNQSGDNVRERRRREAAPLRVWLYAGLFAAILIGQFQLAAHQVNLPTQHAFENHNRTRIERFAKLAAENPDRIRIVLLGNSTLKYSTACDEESLTFEGSRDFQVLRMINYRAIFSDFSPLSEEIFALQPDLILIQAELLGRTRSIEYSSRPAQLQSYLKWRLVGEGDWNPHRIDQEEVQTEQIEYNDQSDERFQRRVRSMTEWQGIDLQGLDAQQAEGLIEEALERGVPVLLHSPPVTARATPLLEEVEAALAPIIRRLSQRPGVSFIEYPGTLPDDCYSDFVHMNDKGRQEYMTWLLPEVARIARTN